MSVDIYSQAIASFRRKLIIGEIALIFLISLVVSVVRFRYNVRSVLFDYPGQPKILIYPVLWIYFLQRTRAWDRSLYIVSRDFYVRLINSAGFTLIAFSTIAYLIKFPISRIWVVANVVSNLIVLVIFRILLRKIYLAKLIQPSEFLYVLISIPEGINSSLEEFKSLYGFTPKYVLLNPPGENSELWLDEYKDLVTNFPIHGTIIGYAQINDAQVLREISDYKRSKVLDVVLVSRISAIVSRFEILDNPTLVRIRESDIIGSGAVVKRLFDIIFSIVALITLAPILAIIAVLVKVSSKGKILYVAERVGQNGNLIKFPKFRSMYQGSDQKRQDILGRPDDEMIARYRSDPRITPVGRFIRRWSLDELPQFWSVLIGTMSIVGPRPILPEELEQVSKNHHIRFIAKPGLTGLWQVTGRKEVAWEDRMNRDIAYLENWSLAKDGILILKTVQAIIKGTGAH